MNNAAKLPRAALVREHPTRPPHHPHTTKGSGGFRLSHCQVFIQLVVTVSKTNYQESVCVYMYWYIMFIACVCVSVHVYVVCVHVHMCMSGSSKRADVHTPTNRLALKHLPPPTLLPLYSGTISKTTNSSSSRCSSVAKRQSMRDTAGGTCPDQGSEFYVIHLQE